MHHFDLTEEKAVIHVQLITRRRITNKHLEISRAWMFGMAVVGFGWFSCILYLICSFNKRCTSKRITLEGSQNRGRDTCVTSDASKLLLYFPVLLQRECFSQGFLSIPLLIEYFGSFYQLFLVCSGPWGHEESDTAKTTKQHQQRVTSKVLLQPQLKCSR